MGLTQEAFNSLLVFLGPNRETAAVKYEEIRRRLLKIFTCRGCAYPEELVDETFDRVAVKAAVLANVYEGDPALYFYRVARRVAFEHFKKRRPVSEPAPSPPPLDDREPELECLERCIGVLPAGQSQLIIGYYREEKGAKIANRRKLAEKLGIGLGALRIRTHRIRAHLTECVKACLERRRLLVASPLPEA